MLGGHRSVQDKARTEVDDVLGDGEINAEHLSRLKYIEMVIKETLRLFPIAPLMVRQLSGELKLGKIIKISRNWRRKYIKIATELHTLIRA